MDEYMKKLEYYASEDDIQIMKQYKQHKTSNTLAHVVHVAAMSHRIEQTLHINVDEDAMLRGALLHDYYLYEFKAQDEIGAYQHAKEHPSVALSNAMEKFDLNDKEQNIIYSHMWPLTLTHLPKSREAWLVSMADKICAAIEFLSSLKPAAGNA